MPEPLTANLETKYGTMLLRIHRRDEIYAEGMELKVSGVHARGDVYLERNGDHFEAQTNIGTLKRIERVKNDTWPSFNTRIAFQCEVMAEVSRFLALNPRLLDRAELIDLNEERERKAAELATAQRKVSELQAELDAIEAKIRGFVTL